MEGVSTATGLVTVTVQEAFLPLSVSAVIIALPDFSAVTFPSFTVAISGLSLDQVTVSRVPSGARTAVTVLLAPSSNVNSFSDKVILLANGATANPSLVLNALYELLT